MKWGSIYGLVTGDGTINNWPFFATISALRHKPTAVFASCHKPATVYVSCRKPAVVFASRRKPSVVPVSRHKLATVSISCHKPMAIAASRCKLTAIFQVHSLYCFSNPRGSCGILATNAFCGDPSWSPMSTCVPCRLLAIDLLRPSATRSSF